MSGELWEGLLASIEQEKHKYDSLGKAALEKLIEEGILF